MRTPSKILFNATDGKSTMTQKQVKTMANILKVWHDLSPAERHSIMVNGRNTETDDINQFQILVTGDIDAIARQLHELKESVGA